MDFLAHSRYLNRLWRQEIIDQACWSRESYPTRSTRASIEKRLRASFDKLRTGRAWGKQTDDRRQKAEGRRQKSEVREGLLEN